MDPLHFAPVLNGVLLGILLYLSGSILNGFQHASGWYKRIILTCLLFSPAIQELYSMMWSETVSLLLILLFVFCMTIYLRKMTNGWLLTVAFVCATACLTRYAAVFLIPTGLGLILINRDEPTGKKLKHGLIFGLISISFFLVNILRNVLLTGLAMGQRPMNDNGIFKILEYFGGVFCDWLSLDRTPALSIFFALLVLLVFAFTSLLLYGQKKSATSFEYTMAFTGLAYALFMLGTASMTRYEQFTSRLLSPLYILLLCCLTWWIPGFLSRRPDRFRWLWTGCSLLLASWFLKIQLAADYEYYDGVKDAGVPGYQEDPFVQSPITQFIEKNKTAFNPDLPVYSNAADAVYFVTGIPARQIPIQDFPAKLQRYYALKDTYLVWFKDLDNPDMPSLSKIQQNKNLQLIKELPDGEIFLSK